MMARWRGLTVLAPVLLTLLFLLAAVAAAAHHEMWKDEIIAWLLARDARTPWEVFSIIKYEGHPGLWHLLLWPLAHLTWNPAAMQGLHVLIASAAVFVLLRYAPFPWPVRVATAAGLHVRLAKTGRGGVDISEDAWDDIRMSWRTIIHSNLHKENVMNAGCSRRPITNAVALIFAGLVTALALPAPTNGAEPAVPTVQPADSMTLDFGNHANTGPSLKQDKGLTDTGKYKEGVTQMNNTKLFILGDSISIHYGQFLEKMVAPQFEYSRKTGTEPQLEGSRFWGEPNGKHSNDGRDYMNLMTADPNWRPDVMLLNAGIHDLTTMDPVTKVKQVPLNLYIQNLTTVLDAMDRRKVQVIWVNTTPVNENYYREHNMDMKHYSADVEAYNAAAAELMAKKVVPVIDLHAFTSSLGGTEIFTDMCHFTEPVARLQAVYIAGYLAAWRESKAGQ
jgi:hypothetical protein